MIKRCTDPAGTVVEDFGSLHSEDHKDLRRSGLSDEMIARMACFSVDAAKIRELTGVTVESGGYAIPYAGVLDQTGRPYHRIRLRSSSRDMRYVAGRGDDPQLYVPSGFGELPGRDLLVITEGEKKSAKAVQEGIPCVGLQGVWSGFDPGCRAVEKSLGMQATEETAPLAVLVEIARRYKSVLVLGDSDLLENPQAKAGLEILAKALSYRDIRAVNAYCPPGVEVQQNGDRRTKKQGLDDWLVADRFRAKRNLSALTFAAEVDHDSVTDTFNARMITRHFGEQLAYSRGVWHHWNGSVWEVDTVGHRRKLASNTSDRYRSFTDRLRDLVRTVTSPFGKKEADWPVEVKVWAAPILAVIAAANEAARKLQNLRGMEAAFQIAESSLHQPDDAWDRDPNLLGVRNGVVDLRTGELLPARPEYRITRLAGAAYDPAAICPAFVNFLARVQPDAEMRLFLQTLMGYSATGYGSEQKFYCFTGTGANGKSTFMALMMQALGNYAWKANTGMFSQQAPDRPRNDLAALVGVRLLSVSETAKHFVIDESLVKTATGDDMISARFLNKEFFQFRPVFTPILDTNNVPGFRETGIAMRRRIRIVPWEISIPESERDKQLGNRLIADELPGMLAWIVQGATRYLDSGLREPRRVLERSMTHMASCDTVGRWLEECTVADQRARTPSSQLFANYETWAGNEGESGVKIKEFAERLKGKGLQSKKTGGVMVWLGLRLRDLRDTTALPVAASPTDTTAADQKSTTFGPTPAGGYIA